MIGAMAVLLGGAIALIRMIIAPTIEVVNNNTQALNRVVNNMDKHDERLDNHEVRVVQLETEHRLRHSR
jgi:hypothetical protein